MGGLDPSGAISIGTSVFDSLDQQRRQNHADHENRQAAARNAELQREFAQNGIRWKMEDARRAGISPALAMGASTIGATPVHIGAETAPPVFGDVGQNISRAIAATSTSDERVMQKMQLQSLRLDLEGKSIDNAIRASQLNNLNGGGPAFPSAMDAPMSGQGDSRRGVLVKPSEVYASEKGRPGIQAGAINSVQYSREASGNIGIVPSADAKQRNEDDFIAETMWHMKNRFMPPAPSTKDYPMSDDLKRRGYKYWLWHPLYQEFIPSKNP